MGEVHHGNTVTDYMEQERQRGITITSAAVTFNWKDYRFNLIDTPGHIDFTMQVEQTLQILDGVVIVLDGTAGVEAQTLTVSRQADRYNIPRIVYVNKMDRPDANFDMCLRSIKSKLNVETLPTQIPVQTAGVLEGIVDVITMDKLTFDKKCQGMNVTRRKLTESDDGSLWEVASEKRRELTDKLSGLDDKLANIVIEQESLKNVTAQALVESLRSVAIDRKGVPVVLGSSYKNVGVQPLMDSIVLYLPSPGNVNKSNFSYRHFEDNLAARVFKIVHDKRRGPITFFRIYSGNIKKGQKLYNVTREQSEQCIHLYVACADDYEEVAEVGYGNIAAVAGLKNTVTGDLVTTSASTANRAKQAMLKQDQPDYVNDFFASGVKLLDPVFFCSIEPPSLLAQSALEVALQELQREDPSLRVSNDPETDQIVLAGMGELHIEIIKERIKREYKIDADLGPLQIAYKETIRDAVRHTLDTEHRVGNTNHRVTITMSLIPNYEGEQKLLLDKSCPDNASNIDHIHPRMMSAIKNGVNAALLHGVKLSCPVINVGVKLHWLEVGRGTSDTMVSAATSKCIRKVGPRLKLVAVVGARYLPVSQVTRAINFIDRSVCSSD